MTCFSSRLAGLCTCLLLAAPLAAQTHVQISLTPASVVGGSPVWDSAAFDGSATFSANNVLNQQSGFVAETAGQGTPDGSFWLGGEAAGNAYFVIDLGAAYQISRIDLFNTHNQGYFDRGAREFTITASASATFYNADAGYVPDGAQTLLSGTLSTVGVDPIPGETYTSANGLAGDSTAYRYLQFVAYNYHGDGPGLAEIRLYTSAIPEPSTYAALAGLGALGLAVWRKRRTVTPHVA